MEATEMKAKTQTAEVNRKTGIYVKWMDAVTQEYLNFNVHLSFILLSINMDWIIDWWP